MIAVALATSILVAGEGISKRPRLLAMWAMEHIWVIAFGTK